MTTMVDYLHTRWHWQQKSYRGDNAYGPCPFHQGMTLKWGQKPDFVIYPPEHSRRGDWHGKCYGASCEISCDFTGLVWRLEFPEIDADDKVGWATKIFPRMAQLGEPVRREPLSSPLSLPKVEKPLPTEEQKAILTAAMTWWNWVLCRLSDGTPGEAYLRQKGILPHYPFVIGYAPKMTSALWRTFDEMICAHLRTKDWHDLGVSVGLLTPGGAARLQERVVYSCLDEEGTSVFYQARTIHDGNSRRRAMFLNPSLSKTRPFTVPLTYAAHEGIVVTESPKGPAILAQYHIRGLALLGSGLPSSLFQEGEHGPVYVATDNDLPRINKKTGEVIFPGEELAEKVTEEARQRGLPTRRLLPPRAYKDVDAWVAALGIDPFLQEMERVRLKS